MKRVGKQAFKCASIETFDWFPEISAIPEECFAWSKLKKIDGTNHVSVIEDCAFIQTQLELFPIFDNLEVVGCSAFAGTLLKEIDFKNASIIIFKDAFRSCKKLKTVDGTKQLEIHDGAFESTDIEEFVWPDRGQSVMYARTFKDCSRLKKILNLKVLRIEEEALKRTRITSLKCSAHEIKQYAFQYCEVLEEVEIFTLSGPFAKSPVNIDSYAFKGCSSLKKLHIYSKAAVFSVEALAQCSERTEVLFPKCEYLQLVVGVNNSPVCKNNKNHSIIINAKQCDDIYINVNDYLKSNLFFVPLQSSVVCEHLPSWIKTSLQIEKNYDTCFHYN